MRVMTTKEVQEVSLDILKDVHNFCINNGIKYTMQGGSIIGAVRHKGFIPWDNDIDIAMPRPGYDLFIRTYKSEKGYKVFSRELPDSEDVLIAYARICDMKNTFVDDSAYCWCRSKKGVWIDLFPLDGVETSYDKCRNDINRMYIIWKAVFLKRWADAPFYMSHGIMNKLKLLVKKIITLPVSYSLVDTHIKMCRKHKWDDCVYYSNLGYLGYGIRERHRKAVLDTVRIVPFEDTEVCIMEGYDEALREKYGEYMTLPPKDKQVTQHSFNNFYWLN